MDHPISLPIGEPGLPGLAAGYAVIQTSNTRHAVAVTLTNQGNGRSRLCYLPAQFPERDQAEEAGMRFRHLVDGTAGNLDMTSELVLSAFRAVTDIVAEVTKREIVLYRASHPLHRLTRLAELDD